jgi:hypothetical protein
MFLKVSLQTKLRNQALNKIEYKSFKKTPPPAGFLYYHQSSLCYFCKMCRLAFITSLLILFVSISSAQIRLNKLVIEAKEKYQILGTDIIVVDTLVMHDSSSIILNSLKQDNFIHAKIASFGHGCAIYGHGVNGAFGKHGEKGVTQSAPCRNGAPGKNASSGERGKDAINLSIYLTVMRIDGSLIVNLNGGDGGKGGSGGRGGDGGSGTRVCPAGDGGSGGNGADGGDGGNAGALSISCKQCPNLHLIIGEKLIVKNYGGFGGVGGDGGAGGQAGLGPLRDGKNGLRGAEGKHASQGKAGLLTLNGN